MMHDRSLTTEANLQERFWSKVVKTDSCWLWAGSRNPQGYGQIRVAGVPIKAHRMAYTLTFGPIPAQMFVCHHCDNPQCVKPSHLFIGDNGDNQRDAARKGRQKGPRLRGEAHGMAKLTNGQAAAIRVAYSSGDFTQWDLAHLYGVTQGAIWRIVRNKGWRI